MDWLVPCKLDWQERKFHRLETAEVKKQPFPPSAATAAEGGKGWQGAADGRSSLRNCFTGERARRGPSERKRKVQIILNNRRKWLSRWKQFQTVAQVVGWAIKIWKLVAFVWKLTGGKVAKRVWPQANPHVIVVRPMPRFVCTYPIAAMALLCALVSVLFQLEGQAAQWLAYVFLATLFVNWIILAFDFPGFVAQAAVLLVLLILALLVIAGSYVNVLAPLVWMWDWFPARANPAFYLVVALLHVPIYVAAWVVARFWYFEITPQQILHNKGIFSNLARIPVSNLAVEKEVPDVWEYALLRMGRLILYPASDRRPIIIDGVLHVSKVEQAIKHLLSAYDVRIDEDADHKTSGGEQ